MYRKITVPLLIFMTIIAVSCSQKSDEDYASITFLLGNVQKNNIEAQIGDIIKQDDVLKTSGDSFCDVKIGGSIIRVKANSNVIISTLLKTGADENTVLGLTKGRMLCKPKKLLKSEKFFIKTPTAVAGVRGTQFSVETDKFKTTRIKVFEGKVKVAKRVKQLESQVEKVVELAPTINKEEKIIITAKDVKKAEKVVEDSLKAEIAKGKSQEDILAKVIFDTKKDLVVRRDNIQKFAASEFARENKEIIEVKAKPKAVIVKITKIIKKTKEEPKPEGRLLVTRYDVYFIKDGKIKWEGKLSSEPVKRGGRIFVAAEDYVFCAESSGPVVWRKNIINNGKIRIEKGEIKLNVGKGEIKLNPINGKKL